MCKEEKVIFSNNALYEDGDQIYIIKTVEFNVLRRTGYISKNDYEELFAADIDMFEINHSFYKIKRFSKMGEWSIYRFRFELLKP